ncbi:MAG: AbrB/MazE/SpoVT family DNA-binding domain-containing protein [Proteobacteria bacterium]|nr:AbrB/MazE/SpoVT family DNA-binding domain-containing protein [Pseudomonadota bacterium]MBS0505996.1 AbrB/MazE/SpoVT family DNA-binding domain-containing protein [Pseudomonadota bacterium]
MHIAIRTIGNSKGVVLPKTLLAQAGLEGVTVATVSVEQGAIVLRKPATLARAGWADAAKAIAAAGDDAMLMGEFGNAADPELSW